MNEFFLPVIFKRNGFVITVRFCRSLIAVAMSVMLFSCQNQLDVNTVSTKTDLRHSLLVPVGSVSVTLGSVLARYVGYPEVKFDDPVEIYFQQIDSIEFPFLPGIDGNTSIVTPPANYVASFIYDQPWHYSKYFPGSTIRFANPKVDLLLKSNVGTYLNFSIDYIKAYSTTNSNIVPEFAWFQNHTSNKLTDYFDSRPTDDAHYVSKSLRTLDSQWGEIKPFFDFSKGTDAIEYQFSAWVDKSREQNDPNPSTFSPNQKIKVFVNTTLPFYLDKGSSFSHSDTSKVDLSGVKNLLESFPANKLTDACFVLEISNAMPCSATFELSFLDGEKNAILTNHQSEYEIKAAEVTADGLIRSSSVPAQSVQLCFSYEELQELTDLNYFISTVKVYGRDLNAQMHFTQSNALNFTVAFFVRTKL